MLDGEFRRSPLVHIADDLASHFPLGRQHGGPNYIPFIPRGLLKRYVMQPTRIKEPRMRALSNAVVAFFDVSGFTAMTEHFGKQGPRGSETVCDILSNFFTQLLVIIERHGGDVIKFAGDAVLVLFEPSYGLPTSLVLPPNVMQQRALACALECAKIEHYEAGVCLRLKAAIASGSVIVADVGRDERWELFLGGPAMHALGGASHDAPVGGVVVAKDTWATSCNLIAEGDVLDSGNVLVTKLAAPYATDGLLAKEWVRLYEQAAEREDVNAAIAPYVPLSARIRLTELSSAHLNDYRELSVLFCSILSSDHKFSETLAALQEVCCLTLQVLERYRGSLRQFLHEDKGITIIALFGLPGNNYFDDAARAVRAAVRLQRELSRHGVGSAIGIATGRIFCGTVGSSTRHEYAAVGPKVNLSARLMQAAEGRAPPILCDGETVEAAKEEFNFTACTPIMVKGKEDAVPVFQPGEKNRDPSRRPTHKALLGRERECGALRAVVERTANSRDGQLVVLKGLPGSGKTTFLQHVSEQMHLRTATIVCRESSGRGAFGAVARLIASLLQARHLLRAKGNKRQTVKEITQSLIAYHRPSLLPYLALLNGVLGVDFSATAASAIVEGPQRTERVYAMLCVVLDNLVRAPARRAETARLNLTMLVINNVEACDESSALFLHHWVSRPLFQCAVLVLVTVLTNDDEWRDVPALVRRLAEHPRATQITMSQLSTDDIFRVVADEWGVAVAELPEPLRDILKDRSLGNPLAAVSLASALKEEKEREPEVKPLSTRSGSGHDVGEVPIPGNLFRLVSSQFDRFPPRISNILITAALIGREFSLATLTAALGADTDEAQLLADLAQIESKNVIRTDGVADDGSTLYSFAYTLIADVAVQSVSFSVKREVHLRLAAHLAARLKEGDAGAEAHAEVSHHLFKAERWEEGIKYGAKAALMYREDFFAPEAISLYRILIGVTKAHPDEAPIELVVSFYRNAAILLSLSSSETKDVHEAVCLLKEGLAAAGKPVLCGSEAKAALPRLQRRLLERLDRRKFVGTAANKALCLEVCRLAERLAFASLMLETNPDGYMHFCLWVTLLEAAEDAGDTEYMLWVYSNSHILLQAVPWSVHSLYRDRLPRVYLALADMDSEAYAAKNPTYVRLMELHRMIFRSNQLTVMFQRLRLLCQTFQLDRAITDRAYHALGFARVWFHAMHQGHSSIAFGNMILSQPAGQYLTLWNEMARGLILDGHLMLGHLEAAEALLKEYEAEGLDRSPVMRFTHIARRLRVLQLHRLFNDEFCSLLKEAWDLAPSVPVRSPQMFHWGMLYHATIAAVEAGPVLASPLKLEVITPLVETLLERMWCLGPIFRPWNMFLWSHQGLFFQVFAKQPAKANVCWRKAERLASELHIDPVLGRLLLQRARYAPIPERRGLYERAAALLSDGSDPVNLATAREGLARLSRSISHA